MVNFEFCLLKFLTRLKSKSGFQFLNSSLKKKSGLGRILPFIQRLYSNSLSYLNFFKNQSLSLHQLLVLSASPENTSFISPLRVGLSLLGTRILTWDLLQMTSPSFLGLLSL